MMVNFLLLREKTFTEEKGKHITTREFESKYQLNQKGVRNGKLCKVEKNVNEL